MRIQYIFLPTLFFILIFSACKKDTSPDERRVFGQILEYGTEIPIVGATVELLSSGTSSTTNTGIIENTTQTDENGRFEMLFKVADISSIKVKADKYYDSVESFLNPGQDNEEILVLEPHVWLSLRIRNELPTEEFDRIRFSYEHGQADLSGWLDFSGPNINETFLSLVTGGNKHGSIIWKTYNSGILQEEYSDTLFISAHDTLHYEIIY